jgi:predicted dehydrogenase
VSPDPTRLRAAVCGSGNRSRTVWQRHLAELDQFELVGVQDVAQASLDRALEHGHVGADAVWLDLDEMLEATKPDVLIACPVNEAHAAAVTAGLAAGCHVLAEKPLAVDLGDAARVTAEAAALGLQLGVVQNWRTKSVGATLHEAVANGVAGEISHVFFRYVRDREGAHLPDYLFSEADPLLFAMTIHHVDTFRFILGDEITSVSGQAAHPRWSRYEHPSVIQLWLETEKGVAISYVATFSSRNRHLPLESLQVEGELGTLYNESAYFEPPLMLSLRDGEDAVDLTADVEVRDQDGQYALADRALLENFHAAVTTGEDLIAPAADNLKTLSVVAAASRALREGIAVSPAGELERASAHA